jgi:Mannosyltransferase (PIG-V)
VSDSASRPPGDVLPETPAVPTAPAWARAADVAVVILFCGALYVAAAGRPFLLRWGEIVLPAPMQWLFAAVALLAIRHAAHPRPAIGSTFARWRQRLNERPHAAAAVRAFVFTRPAVFLVAYFAVVTIGFPPRPVGSTLSPDPLANLPSRFDSGWYGTIARFGYQWDRQYGRQGNIAFFPAMPMLMRPVGSFLGATTPTLPGDKRMLRMLWAGVVVSLVAFAWALYYLSRLSDLIAGPSAAAYAPLLLASYPFAIFFSVPYTESLFLLSSLGAFYHFHRGEWIRSSVWGLIVGLSRPNGCLVSVALAVLTLEQIVRAVRAGALMWSLPSLTKPLGVRLAVAAMPGVAMLLFTAYLYRLTGVWLVWARMHSAWGRKWGTGPIERGWEWLRTEGLMTVFQGVPYDTLNTLAVLFALALLWMVFRYVGPAYGTFVVLDLVPPIFAGGSLSMGRVTSTLFPIFIALSARVRPSAIPGWVAAFAVFQGFVAALFFTWRELF